MLGAHNLDTVARELLLIMIHFTSPSCVECQAIAEELVKAAEELYEYYIPVAKVRSRPRELWGGFAYCACWLPHYGVRD